MKWRCPNCKRTRETDENIIMVRCGCGEYMESEKEEKNGRKRK